MECCDHDEFEYMECAKVGQKVRNFTMDAYDPSITNRNHLEISKCPSSTAK